MNGRDAKQSAAAALGALIAVVLVAAGVAISIRSGGAPAVSAAAEAEPQPPATTLTDRDAFLIEVQKGLRPASIADHQGNIVGTAYIAGPKREDVVLPGGITAINVYSDGGVIVGFMTDRAGFVPKAMVDNGHIAQVKDCWEQGSGVTAECETLLAEQGIHVTRPSDTPATEPPTTDTSAP